MGKTVFFFRKKNMWFPENSKIYKKNIDFKLIFPEPS